MRAEINLPIVRLGSFLGRLRGLIGRPAPAPGQGVWIIPCRQVHTLGMGYAIDVIYLDGDRWVLAVQTLRPWRVGRFFLRAASVVELRAGEAERLGIGTGTRLALIESETSC